jgi:hypothetical protein
MIYKSLIHEQKELIGSKVNFYLSMGQAIESNELLKKFYNYSVE